MPLLPFLVEAPAKFQLSIVMTALVFFLIGSTKSSEGLEVHAWLDEGRYEKGRKVTDAELEELYIRPMKFHGEWNYEIYPRPK